jgi:hypothetical protein
MYKYPIPTHPEVTTHALALHVVIIIAIAWCICGLATSVWAASMYLRQLRLETAGRPSVGQTLWTILDALTNVFHWPTFLIQYWMARNLERLTTDFQKKNWPDR